MRAVGYVDAVTGTVVHKLWELLKALSQCLCDLGVWNSTKIALQGQSRGPGPSSSVKHSKQCLVPLEYGSKTCFFGGVWAYCSCILTCVSLFMFDWICPLPTTFNLLSVLGEQQPYISRREKQFFVLFPDLARFSRVPTLHPSCFCKSNASKPSFSFLELWPEGLEHLSLASCSSIPCEQGVTPILPGSGPQAYSWWCKLSELRVQPDLWRFPNNGKRWWKQRKTYRWGEISQGCQGSCLRSLNQMETELHHPQLPHPQTSHLPCAKQKQPHPSPAMLAHSLVNKWQIPRVILSKSSWHPQLIIVTTEVSPCSSD